MVCSPFSSEFSTPFCHSRILAQEIRLAKVDIFAGVKNDTEWEASNQKGTANMLSYEQRPTFITNIHADLVFQACISFLRCCRTPGTPIRKTPVYPGMLPCVVS